MYYNFSSFFWYVIKKELKLKIHNKYAKKKKKNERL